jgi:hypothetical protein
MTHIGDIGDIAGIVGLGPCACALSEKRPVLIV